MKTLDEFLGAGIGLSAAAVLCAAAYANINSGAIRRTKNRLGGYNTEAVQEFYRTSLAGYERELAKTPWIGGAGVTSLLIFLFVNFNKEYSMELLESPLVKFFINATIVGIGGIVLCGFVAVGIRMVRYGGDQWFNLMERKREDDIASIEAKGVEATTELKALQCRQTLQLAKQSLKTPTQPRSADADDIVIKS